MNNKIKVIKRTAYGLRGAAESGDRRRITTYERVDQRLIELRSVETDFVTFCGERNGESRAHGAGSDDSQFHKRICGGLDQDSSS